MTAIAAAAAAHTGVLPEHSVQTIPPTFAEILAGLCDIIDSCGLYSNIFSCLSQESDN